MKRIAKLVTVSRMFCVVMVTLVSFSTTNAQIQKRDTTRMGHHRFENGRHDKHDGGLYGIPNLTEEQRTKIKALRTPLSKEMLPIINQLGEKQAHLKTLQTADKVDMTAINSTIDEIGQLRSQLAKKKAAHTQAIRKILTDDQRIAFDMQSTRKRAGHSLRSRHFHGKSE